jgi:hypothetical protein
MERSIRCITILPNSRSIITIDGYEGVIRINTTGQNPVVSIQTDDSPYIHALSMPFYVPKLVEKEGG